MRDTLDIHYMKMAQLYADQHSGCRKVSVGSAIVKGGRIRSLGANVAVPDLCLCTDCMRVQKYGNDSKIHRNPEDCRAVHSEIDALVTLDGNAAGSTIYVTRYPCEACARAIVAAGVKQVVYGGKASISALTREIFEYGGVTYRHLPWGDDDSDR